VKRVDQIISSIRERTRNLNYSRDATTGEVREGISDDLILEYLNEAQDHLQASILAVYPNEFDKTIVIPISGGQEEYEITDRIFINNKLISIQYRASGGDSDYSPLDQLMFRDRNTTRGYPSYYIRRGNKILLNPVPQSSVGDIRVAFYRELDDVDIRRGTISSHTATATQLTALTLQTSDDDALSLANADYLCINDRYGTVTMYNIPITSYDSATGVVTFSAFTFATGETIANGDYVTVGKYTTTHSKLPDNCERFLRMYAQKRVLITDESATSMEEDGELVNIKQDIITSFADESRDIKMFPIVDVDIMY